jgi:hypothetical protein
MTVIEVDIQSPHITLTRPVDNGPSFKDYSGFFTIKFDKVNKCGCGRRLEFVECDEKHIVVVWEEKDDDDLLAIAAAFKDRGLGPKIVEYKVGYGQAHEFHDAVEKGLIEWP